MADKQPGIDKHEDEEGNSVLLTGARGLWSARALANGGTVRFIDPVDGGFDITVETDHKEYVVELRSSAEITIKGR